MATKISIDKAGRVVLPKSLREKMPAEAGDEFLIEAEGDHITLRPIRQVALPKGAWHLGVSGRIFEHVSSGIDRRRT